MDADRAADGEDAAAAAGEVVQVQAGELVAAVVEGAAAGRILGGRARLAVAELAVEGVDALERGADVGVSDAGAAAAVAAGGGLLDGRASLLFVAEALVADEVIGAGAGGRAGELAEVVERLATAGEREADDERERSEAGRGRRGGEVGAHVRTAPRW
ncbi:MAG: hypothetical protein JST92_18525 [Deltaproteobacteria bacterium]|nr:hypothetical protein [Deltaproteobacteria bacterium]